MAQMKADIKKSDSRTKKNADKRPFFTTVGILTVAIVLISIYTVVKTAYYEAEVLGISSQRQVVLDEACPSLKNLKPEHLTLSSDRTWLLINYPQDKANHIKMSINMEEFNLPDTVTLKVYDRENTEELVLEAASTKISDTEYSFDHRILSPGEYKVAAEVKSECYTIESVPTDVIVSYPVVVSWTQDWEGDDVKDEYVKDLERISAQYKVPMTHYWSPRIYVDDEVIPVSRQDSLTSWVKNRRDNYGEEIGLHIHMFDNLVEKLELRDHEVKWGQREDGYDRLVGEYKSDEFLKVLNWSESEFQKRGLGQPNNFRAGGWYASLNTLQALEQKGYRIDSSGREKYEMGWNKKAGYWDLPVTMQPFHPSKVNQNIQMSNSDSNFKLIEAPNNIGNTWAHSEEEILSRFNKNYNGGPADGVIVMNLLSHPHWHFMDGPKLDKVFPYMHKFSYQNDKGPVIFLTVSDGIDIWESSQSENVSEG